MTKFTNIFIFLNTKKQIVPSERTGKEVSFEWQNHRILSKHTRVPAGGGGGVLRLPSDRNDRRIFLGLKFSISGFFWVGKFWQVFFWG